tara:strand:- start:94 stop:306 length:213 start_codon:yes stop_codon:yes gene_type:complete
MNDTIRDITHSNVEKLLAAIVAERVLRQELQSKVDALQQTINQMTGELAKTTARANAAFAIAQGGSSTSR